MARTFDEITALLGSGTRFDGKLTFEGSVRIDGEFHGEILSNDVLILGEGSEIHAEVRVGTLIVQGGEIHGDIHASEQVEIHYPGRVHGNIVSPSLFIDKGVIFEGECRMDPGTEGPMPTIPEED